jgi:DNA polymerase III alpha subunit
MTVDEYGQVHYSIKEIIEILYQRPDFDLSEIAIEKTENNKYNEHCEELLEEMQILSDHNALTENVEDFHKMRMNTWFMPDAYKRLDILEFCLDQCETTEERQRVNDEMMMFESRKLIPVLQYIKYLVDTMRKNKIVWGVGRGSSLSSFVLFLLGINKVNPLLHNLDIHEFLR